MLCIATSSAVICQPAPDQTPPLEPTYYTLKSGETLTQVALRYGTTVRQLVLSNHIANPNRVPIGARLTIEAQTRRMSRPPALPSAPPARDTPNTVSLVFTKADVRDVLTQIAGYTSADILVTPGASGVVSINLRSRTAEDAIRLVAAVAGLSVAKVGGAFIVGPAADVQKATAEFGEAQLVPLRYITPADAVRALSQMVVRVKTEVTSKGVILSGLPRDVARAQAVLRELDVEPAPAVPPKPETAVHNVQAGDSAEIERVLHEVYPGITVSRQNRTLILTGIPADLAGAKSVITSLDTAVPKQPAPREVLVYRLKFLNARSAATALRSAISGGPLPAADSSTPQTSGQGADAAIDNGPVAIGDLTITLAPEAVAPPTAIFNPLTSANGLGSSNSSGSSGTSSGTGAGGAGGGAGGAAGGAAPQMLSRPTRLILIGPRDKIDLARTLLEQTDLPQPLVRIEAFVVEVNSAFTKNLGLNWDVSGTNFTFNQPAGAGSLITGQGHATVALSALISQNHARVLASPNISVVDNEDASIFIGELRRFLGETVLTPNSGTIQAVDSLPVGIALLIRPRIHPDGQVTLKVHPVISSVTSTVNGLPQTSSREADTTVRLKQGEELVIGGLDQSEVTRLVQKLPILGDIPWIGELFRNRTHTVKKTTIVVIIRAFPLFAEQAPARDFRKGIVNERD